MWWWYWFIFALLFGWSWWWWWFSWRWWWHWWWWWWIPFPPRPNPPDPPPYDRLRLGRLTWISQVAAAIGGAGAWAVLGPKVAPDGGLLSTCLVAAVGATFLGSLAVNLVGAPARTDAAP